MEKKKGTISSPAASPEEIYEALPVPWDLDILPTPSHTDPFDPVVPAVPAGYDVPPGFNVKEPTVRRNKFKPSSTVPINATRISFAFKGQNKPGQVRKGKRPVSSLAASPEEIQEALPVPCDLDILPTPSHTGPFDPVVLAVPPGYDVPPGFNVKEPTVRRNKFKPSSTVQNKPGKVRKGKTPVLSPTASPEEIQEALPVPLDLDILPNSYHTDPFDPVVPAVPPGFNVKEPTVGRNRFKSSSTVPINATQISFAYEGKNKPGQVRKGKTPVSSPAASPEEIQEALPVPLDLVILPNPSDTDPFDPVVPAVPPGYDVPPGLNFQDRSSTVVINATSISVAFEGQNKPGQVRKGKTPVSDETTATKKAKPLVRILSTDLALLASSSNAGTEPRAHAEAILATFDALRRRLEQISKANCVNNRPDMKAEMIMKANDLMVNRTKQVGAVPGVEVGDIFYFRMEMCVVGLHALPMAGIDYMKDGTNQIAIAIVSSGGYENEDDDAGKMVYTGQGGKGRKKEQICDQELERGNYAMEQSKFGENLIRVIRSRKDPFIRGNKVYIYDGLYKIEKSGDEKSDSGFRTFKYNLVRESGQPDVFTLWKMTEKWKKEPTSRGTVLTSDLSSGVESIKVTVVNEVDDEPKPDNFSYVTTIVHKPMHGQIMRVKDKVPAGCKCKKLCVPGGTDCYCMSENGGWLAYISPGLLTKRLPLLYECGSGCECTIKCQNRVTQRGVKLHFEVFRTKSRGWGLRSWDPIRAGSFVCEFVGEYLENPCADSKELILNEYVFRATHPGEKAEKWNLGMELATEGDEKYYEPELVPVPMISAQDIGNVSRFINHSCNPNLFWQLVRYGHGDSPYTHVMFFSTKHIPPLTELTYDYNGDTEGSRDRGVGAKRCFCAAANCRMRFG